MGLTLLASLLAAAALPCAAQWRAPSGVTVSTGGSVVSAAEREFDLTSAEQFPAAPGDVFEIRVRIKLDLHTRALPDLACYDAGGREIPSRSVLESAARTATTDWQDFVRIYPVLPGTASVRARIRAAGRGTFQTAGLEFRPARIDSYRTGALVTQVHPQTRRGLVLESNLGIVNPELVSREDRDGDGKWALIQVDLDELSKLEKPGVDWRTRFEYKPNVIYWSDGAVLKSDSVREDRPPGAERALHFRMKVSPGRYHAILNDPGRAAAISTDGRNWKRYPGGDEPDLGTLDARGGAIELWIDACFRDPVTAGPVYFDYVRLFPADDPEADERLFQAARRRPAAQVRGSGRERRVPVEVEAPRDWPVRCGLPVPPGELASAGEAAVLDSSGRALPSQNRVLATWPDGSVKWLHLDFFSTGDPRYTVVLGRRPPEATVGVRLRETAAGIEVDAGAIRFTVPKSGFGLIENVRNSAGQVLQPGPAAAEIVEESGRKWPVPDARLSIEQAGPLHAVIAAEARGFRARIHAYAGRPLVGIDYFLANMDDRDSVRVKSIALNFPAPGRLSGAEVQASEKGTPRGWASNGSLAAGVEAFAEQYPKALRWSPAGIRIDLWAPEGGVYEWIQGVGKTHRIALYYGDPGAEGAMLARGPALALADPEWYANSGAFGPIGTAARSPLPAVEKTLASHMAERVVRRVGLGFENWGDHSSSGYVQGTYLWDNNEYDLPAAAFVHFARTGDRDALRIALASAQHYVDVDRIHHSRRRPDDVGAAHTHSHGDVGHHTADNPNMHHAGYVFGLLLATYFSGDPDGLDGARTIADWVLRNLKPETNVGGMERALGHPLMTLTDVYEATWDDRYLRGAARLVDWAIHWEHPVHSGFLAPISEQPAYYSGSTFCGGLLPTGLMKFNSWARLPEIDAMLERVARWTLTEMWRPPAGIMSKGGSPRRKADADNISSHLRLMREQYLRTRDPLFLALPREAVEAGFGEGASFGTRSTGLVFNYVPWFAAALRELGDPRPGKLEAHATSGLPRLCFSIVNRETVPAEDLRAGFQPRLDFTVISSAAAPARLEPGQSAELCYEVKPPAAINLTSEYNRVSYAHWTASYVAGGQPKTAHRWVKIALGTGEAGQR